jgi:SAM-dependent methyltransferase
MKPANHAFDELVQESFDAPFEGWDFSYLAGRRSEGVLPWSYEGIARDRMETAQAMLDMGTGGGELLASLRPLPRRTFATEGYAPNVPIARQRLEPLGVQVYDTTGDPENAHLPFSDGEFDLILNRHEAYTPQELWRLLRDGGTFLTQQCGGGGEVELIEWFKGKGNAEVMDWSLSVAVRQMAAVGFRIDAAQEAFPETTFADVGAVVYYLRAAPWLMDDFTVEKYRDRLLAMHHHIQQHGGFTVPDERFLLEAIKPG